MVSRRKQIVLLNSEPQHPQGARRLRTRPDDQEIIKVTVVVRSRRSAPERNNLLKQFDIPLSKKTKSLTLKEFVKAHGATKNDIDEVTKFARQYRLQVVEKSQAKRAVVLSGTIRAMSRAFNTEPTHHEHEGRVYRSYQGQIRLPASLEDIVVAVLGLDNRALMNHHGFAHADYAKTHIDPKEVSKTYHFPNNADGKGQTIAIIELGGGFYRSDIEAYFTKLGLSQPQIDVIEIDSQRNQPTRREAIKEMLDAMGVTSEQKPQKLPLEEAIQTLWTIEATLDIELAGAFANGAQIVVYFAPNNSQGKYHALTSALTSEKHQASIISCSWGAAEDTLGADFVTAFDQVLQDAALRGVTVCFSSGDRGSDPDKDGQPRAHFPASSPNVLACGGTHWMQPAGEITEVVWSEKLPTTTAQSGGGVSKLFAQPSWQTSAGVEWKTDKNGRGVPDVAGKADMATGYEMIVGGYSATMGGTSSVVPMWAGLVARLNQILGQNIGYLTSFLYQDICRTVFSDITEGSNGAYQAKPGWDACTGMGTPDGMALLAALKQRS